LISKHGAVLAQKLGSATSQLAIFLGEFMMIVERLAKAPLGSQGASVGAVS
jgi:hypothetical protein